MADDIKNLEEQGQRDGDSADQWEPTDLASFFGAKIKQHDDEKKEDHNRARIDQHLNDADEIGIERHEERGETKKRNHQAQCTGHGIAIGDHGDAEDEHEQRKGPK